MAVKAGFGLLRSQTEWVGFTGLGSAGAGAGSRFSTGTGKDKKEA